MDFENVQQIDLSKLADDFHVTIFMDSTQKSLPFERVQGVQHLGTKLEWLKVEGNGSNALDFHIADYLDAGLLNFQRRSTSFCPKIVA